MQTQSQGEMGQVRTHNWSWNICQWFTASDLSTEYLLALFISYKIYQVLFTLCDP